MSKFYPNLYINVKNNFVSEGVGDKYAEQEFNIPDELSNYVLPNADFIGIITHDYIGNKLKKVTKIYCNPASLDDFVPFVRGIILKNGDLYVANSNEVIHIDIVNFLIKNNIIDGPSTINDLEEFMSNEYEYPKVFIGIQRLARKNIFAISESNNAALNNMTFFKDAKIKNPTFEFANKDVHTLNRLLKEEVDTKKAYKTLVHDIKYPVLNKKILGTMTDVGNQIVKICGVNGDFVRDKDPGLNFDQFVDGGHYYVTSYPEYKKVIPEDEIWIDDVFEMKPNDLKAIVLHEFVERNKMKYRHWSYEKAHEYANKKEMIYRLKIKK